MNFTLKHLGWALFTFGIYCLLVSWPVALMLIIGVGFHEYSHLYAADRLGLKTKGFYLIPFVGGVALVGEKYKTLREQAIVVLAGPAGGGALALFTAGLYYLTNIQFFGQAAVWMCVLNLLNLLPLSFMDGGQLLGTITYSVNKTLGFICLAVSTVVAIVILWHLSWVLCLFVTFLGSQAVLREYRNWSYFREGKLYMCDENYLNPPSKLSEKEILLVIVGWLTVMAVLTGATALLVQDPGNDFMLLFK